MLPLKKILVPTDFSEAALAALEHAKVLSREADAELVLIHVLPPLTAPAADLLFITMESDVEREAAANAHLNEVVAQHLADNGRVAVLVKMGDAAHEIACAARDNGCDLIVMSTHGVGGWQHLVLGSVAEAVARLASCPVLTVRQRRNGTVVQPAPIRKILCPIDFSEPSLGAIATAGELASQWKSQLRLLHVLEPLKPVLGVVGAQQFSNECAAEAARAMLPIIEKYVPADLQAETKLHRLIRQGPSAEQIIRAAEHERADLIVVATHGHTGWRHMVFGSVAEEVVRTAPCLVLTVHASAADSAAGASTAKQEFSYVGRE